MLNASRILFAPIADYAALATALEDGAQGAHVNIAGGRAAWQRITVFFPAARLTLTAHASAAAGDVFSTTIENTVAILKKGGKTPPPVLERLARSALVVTVTAEPAVPHTVFANLIPALAGAADGLIFDGVTLKDADGTPLGSA